VRAASAKKQNGDTGNKARHREPICDLTLSPLGERVDRVPMYFIGRRGE
jgi:hypothetical protein